MTADWSGVGLAFLVAGGDGQPVTPFTRLFGIYPLREKF